MRSRFESALREDEIGFALLKVTLAVLVFSREKLCFKLSDRVGECRTLCYTGRVIIPPVGRKIRNDSDVCLLRLDHSISTSTWN